MLQLLKGPFEKLVMMGIKFPKQMAIWGLYLVFWGGCRYKCPKGHSLEVGDYRAPRLLVVKETKMKNYVPSWPTYVCKF